MTHKFETLADVRDYVGGERIQCLICKKWFKRLQRRHLHMHGLDADGYREMFGIPWTYSLTSRPSREATGRTVKPSQKANLTYHVKAGDKFKYRPSAPAVRKQWREVSSVLGPDCNARVYVTESCQDCGTDVVTTKLTRVHGVRCKACSQERQLALRKAKRAVRLLESVIKAYNYQPSLHVLRPAA